MMVTDEFQLYNTTILVSKCKCVMRACTFHDPYIPLQTKPPHNKGIAIHIYTASTQIPFASPYTYLSRPFFLYKQHIPYTNPHEHLIMKTHFDASILATEHFNYWTFCLFKNTF